jgi:hypothetical protein
MASVPMTGWHCYGFFNALDELLYVGMSSRPPYMRLMENLRDQPWRVEYHSHRVLRKDIATEALALACELALIQRLQPRFNIVGNEGNPNRVSPYTMRFVAGTFRGQPYRPDLYPQPFAWTPSAAGPYILRQRTPRHHVRAASRGVTYRASRWSWLPRWRPSTSVRVVACLVVWFALSALAAMVWPRAATPALGPVGRLTGAMTVVGIGFTATPERWRSRWLMLAAVLALGFTALSLTRGL